jgi:hypothetical protein
MGTKYSSQDLEITFNGTDITGDGASLDVDESEPAEDVTGFGDEDSEHIASGVTERKATYDGFDSTEETIYDALVPGTEGTLEWYPQGNSTGNPKKSVTAIVTNRKRSYKVRKAVALSAEFQLSGAVTDSTVA